MNLNEINFTFAGKHCLRDFGCIYVENGGHIISPQVQRNLYSIAGMSGTLVLPGKTYLPFTLSGTLFFEVSPPSQAAAQEALRRITAWLGQDRDKLVFDYEPGRYYLAEISSPTNWAFDSWIDGGLSITMDCQPFAFSRNETTLTRKTSGTAETFSLNLDTRENAPLNVHIQNTNAAPITAARVQVGSKVVQLAGMQLAKGQILKIAMEPPAGVWIGSTLAFTYCKQFDYLTAAPGPNAVTISLAYGSGMRGATLTVSARGRT